ncbi:MAG: hypothetical protein M3Y35_18940 [Actinomycetota bacterium]|nr:hypothetical protein [Actinomycetota bacterium]
MQRIEAGLAVIERIDVYSHRASVRSTWTVIRVEASTGAVGIGECSDSGSATVIEAAVAAARSALIGHPVDSNRDALRAWLNGRRGQADPVAGFAWSTALGGLEAALDDLSARQAGVPLAQYLGSRPAERVRLYANLNRTWGGHGLADLVTAARTAASEGFPAVKIAPFDSVPRSDVVSGGLSVVDAVRSAIPQDTALMIDCHFRLDDDALRVALPELAARDVYWVEDAVDPRDVERLCRVRELTPVALAAGEQAWDPAVVEAACATEAVDYWLIDPKHAGGPRATRHLLGLTGHAQVSYHNPSGPVGTVHAAQLCQLSPRITWLEYAWGEPDRAAYLSPAEKIENGSLVVPDGPGVSVALAADGLEVAMDA